LDYPAYVAGVRERLTALSFAEAELTENLEQHIVLGMEREESWGRLIIALARQLNQTDLRQAEEQVAAAGAWARSAAEERACHVILVFPFDRRVEEEESAQILALREEGPDRRWSVIPWTADLDVELLDRHSGFPPVDAEVARALTEVPRGAVEQLVRRSTGPRIGRPRLVSGLSYLPATRLILATTIAYYIWTILIGGQGLFGALNLVATGPNVGTLLAWGANHGEKALVEGQQWRLATYLLLHGGLLHLGFNMWALWRLGQYVEMVYGSGRMFFIYMVAGVTGGIASAAFRAIPVPSVGASGAIMGLLGALLYFGWAFRERRVNWQAFLTPVMINLLYGFMIPVVDNQAHIGGLLGGLAAAFVAGVPGERHAWRTWAMGAVAVLLVLVLGGVVPLSGLVRW